MVLWITICHKLDKLDEVDKYHVKQLLKLIQENSTNLNCPITSKGIKLVTSPSQKVKNKAQSDSAGEFYHTYMVSYIHDQREKNPANQIQQHTLLNTVRFISVIKRFCLTSPNILRWYTIVRRNKAKWSS